MRIRSCLHLALVGALGCGLVMLGPAGNVARAARISTETAIEQDAGAEAREQLQAFLARDDVSRELRALGVDGEEASRRVAALTDREAIDVAGKIEQLPAGGVIGVLVGAVLLVFFVLLLTDILGLTNVFSFVNSPQRR